MAISLFTFHTVGISAHADSMDFFFFNLYFFNYDVSKNALWVKRLQCCNGILDHKKDVPDKYML